MMVRSIFLKLPIDPLSTDWVRQDGRNMRQSNDSQEWELIDVER